ncbi:hypothetical protein NLI96_g567 [Meripilus lineatus]|uniref:F-box domain-containing protein n=1 Tax=Meripilus lineatus TaxID=2056292 RepID=A0AAD5VGC9_9APHY|nr:hypothetical protein NLI96_g567 [Physisporinus lineatus]
MWNELALPHIFRIVTVCLDATDTKSFLDLISDKPMIGHAVRELALLSPDPEDDDTPFYLSTPIMHETMKMLVGKMSRLRVLYLISIYDTGEHSPPELFRNLSTFRNIERVEILGCRFPLSLLQAYVSAFPGLRSLVLNDSDEEEKDLLPFRSEVHPLSIERLRIRCLPQPPPVLSWLASSNSKMTLKNLRLDVDIIPNSPIQDFLRQIGPSLVELDLKLPELLPVPYNKSLDPEGEVNLKDATQLLSLTLRPAHSVYILNTLSTVAAPRLAQLKLTVLEYDSTIDEMYRKLALGIQSLQALRFLEEIVFIYKGSMEYFEEAEAALKTIFVKAGVRCTVTVVHSSSLKRWWLSG